MHKVLLGLGLLITQLAVAQTYTVTTTADSGPGSLRDAIVEANAGNYDRVVFDVSPSSTATDTIFLNSDLPTIMVTLEIDGSTESGFSTFNKPRIILKANDPSCNVGLGYGVDSFSVVKNIGIYGFNTAIIAGQKKWTADGLYIGAANLCYISLLSTSDSCKITNCVLGYGGDGSIRGSNSMGIYLSGKGSVVGGAGQENIIANVQGNAIILNNYTGTCYENTFINVPPVVGPAQIIYESSGMATPSYTYTIAGNNVNIVGQNQPGDTIFAMISDSEYSFGPLRYKAIADAAGNWNISIPAPADKNLHAYMGRRDVNGFNAKIDKRHSFGTFYDTIWVTNTMGNNIYTHGSLAWAVNTAISTKGNKRILFVPSIDLTTPIVNTTFINTAGSVNDGNIIIDGKGKVRIECVYTPFQFNSANGATFELRGIQFDLMNASFIVWAYDRATIDSCYGYNCNNIAIRSFNNGVTLKNSKFWDIKQVLYAVSSADTVVNCEFGIRYLPYAGGYSGIYEPILLSATTSSYIKDNIFQDIGDKTQPVTTYQGCAIRTYTGADRYTIDNNKFINVHGSALLLGTQHGSFDQPYHDCVVKNNYFTGIESYAIYAVSIDTLLIHNNTITCQDSSAFRLVNSIRIKLSENTFSSTLRPGISMIGTHNSIPANYNKATPVITTYNNSILSGTTTAGDTVEVFLADAASPSSAIKFLGKVYSPGGSWSLPIPAQWQGGSYVAIATDGDGNSSSLSTAYGVSGQRDIYVVRSPADTGCYCLREGIKAVNNGSADYINFDLNGDTEIQIENRLPTITSPVTIDGTTQSGYSYAAGPSVVFKYDSIAVDAPSCAAFNPVAFTALDIQSDDVTVKAIGFDGFGRAINLESGFNHHINSCEFTHTQVRNTIDISSSQVLIDSCSFIDNKIDNTAYGCDFSTTYENVLINVTGNNVLINKNTFTGNFAPYYIKSTNANTLKVADNTAEIAANRVSPVNLFYFIYATHSQNIECLNNKISSPELFYRVVGLAADTSTHVVVRNNTFNPISEFVKLIYVQNADIVSNTFAARQGFSTPGIHMLEVNHVVVDSNAIRGGGDGAGVVMMTNSDPFPRRSDSIWIRDNYMSNYNGAIQMGSEDYAFVEARRNTMSVCCYASVMGGVANKNEGIVPPVILADNSNNQLVLKGTSTPGFRIELFTFQGPFRNIEHYIGDAIADADGNWSFIVPQAYYNPLVNSSYTGTVTGLKRNTSAYTFPINVTGDICAAGDYRYWNGENIVSCPNDTVTLSVPVAAGNTVLWLGPNSFSATTAAIKAKEKGTYLVQVTNAAGTCTWKDSVMVDYKLGASIPDFLIADKAGPGETMVAVEITYPLVDSSAWNFYGAPYVKSGSSYMVTYADAGTYKVTMRSYLGTCYQDVTKTVTIDPAYAHQSHTVTPGAADIADVIVRPNPNDGVFDLEILLNEEKDVTVDWLNAGTQKVEHEWSFTGSDYYQQHIDIAPLSTGIYLLRVFTKDDARIVKVVVQ